MPISIVFLKIPSTLAIRLAIMVPVSCFAVGSSSFVRLLGALGALALASSRILGAPGPYVALGGFLDRPLAVPSWGLGSLWVLPWPVRVPALAPWSSLRTSLVLPRWAPAPYVLPLKRRRYLGEQVLVRLISVAVFRRVGLALVSNFERNPRCFLHVIAFFVAAHNVF